MTYRLARSMKKKDTQFITVISGNDRAMIEAAGLGVAMGNATDDIRKIADVTTDDNNHDGVAAAIEKYVL